MYPNYSVVRDIVRCEPVRTNVQCSSVPQDDLMDVRRPTAYHVAFETASTLLYTVNYYK